MTLGICTGGLSHTSQDPLRDNYGDLPLNMSQMEERVYSSTE